MHIIITYYYIIFNKKYKNIRIKFHIVFLLFFKNITATIVPITSATGIDNHIKSSAFAKNVNRYARGNTAAISLIKEIISDFTPEPRACNIH